MGRIRLAFVVSLSAGLVASMLPASANYYSFGGDNSVTVGYTGLSTYRSDGSFTMPAGGSTCGPYTSPAVFQTMWININSPPTNWIELGTGHGRGTNGYCRYWFWGYGYQGAWYSVGTQMLGSGSFPGTRTMLGKTPAACANVYICYDWLIGGVLKGTLVWDVKGLYVTAGLEPTITTATAAAHDYQTLQFKANFGGWQPWAGRDLSVVNTPTMCGRWVADNRWRASENSPC